MRSIIGIVLFMCVSVSFPADKSQTLQERYGQPISETYRVRPGVVASAQFGASGHACAIVVEPEKPEYPLTSPKNTIGDDKQTDEILRELVPQAERGNPAIVGFVNVGCAEMDCSGTDEDLEKVTIFRSGSNDRQHFATIRWKRDECKDIDRYVRVRVPIE